ncbi:MAG: GSCFA domain-containing protein [Chitinophagaceae bacterium]|nr:GSCFA domain-containing protein [Chitinophagaceae bacterium]
MEFMLNIELPKAEKLISHKDNILSVGSCFTEHIGEALQELKFNVLQNPNGILFDPVSVCKSLQSYIQNRKYTTDDLFYLNELWHSWDHHSRFSNTDAQKAVDEINASQQTAREFLKDADWLIITLGSAFNYHLVPEPPLQMERRSVANCHRAPAQWFEKHLSAIEDIISNLQQTIEQLFQFNPKLKIIFTISPVRHIRDGVVENNRSKARLIEAVHHVINQSNKLYYFPSYEIVIDVLRDYRFYAEDMVHPNYAATEFVLEKFIQTYMSDETVALIQEIKKLVIARKHRSVHPSTEAHKKFLLSHLEKTKALRQQYPYLNLQEEIDYFSNCVYQE